MRTGSKQNDSRSGISSRSDRVSATGLDLVEVERLIRGFLSPLVIDGDDLADLTQDCLVRVWSRSDTFQGRSAFSSWVYRVVRNEFFSWTRSRARQEKWRRHWVELSRTSDDDQLEHTVLNKVTTHKLLGDLLGVDRNLLERRFLDGWTSAQIGRDLGLAPSSVRCRILRLRAAHCRPPA